MDRIENAEYPERSRYFGFKGNIKYYPYKTRCPNCGKVCIEDFWAAKREPTKNSPLINCHRCGHDTRNNPHPHLWIRVGSKF